MSGHAPTTDLKKIKTQEQVSRIYVDELRAALHNIMTNCDMKTVKFYLNFLG